MPEIDRTTRALTAASKAGRRADIYKYAFDLELIIAQLGHVPPDVYDSVSSLIRELDPLTEPAYVVLVNLLQQQWSKLTAFQRKEVLAILEPHTAHLEFFEAQQAILELCSGKHLG